MEGRPRARLCRLYWRLRCLLADAHNTSHAKHSPGPSDLVTWHNGEIGDATRNGPVDGAPRTVPSSSGHRNTVLAAALSRTRRLHGSAIKRPTTHYRPEPATSPVVGLRYNSHRDALRPTTSGLAKEDVLGECREAHLVQVISRCLCVSGRLPSGRGFTSLKTSAEKPGWRA